MWRYNKKVLGRTNHILSFNTTQTTQKMKLPTIICCRGNIFTELLPSNNREIHRTSDSPLIRHGHHRKWYVQHSSFAACICCQSNVFTVLLPSTEMRDMLYQTFAYRQTDGKDLWSMQMRGAQLPWSMSYHTNFHTDRFRYSNVDGGIRTDRTDTAKAYFRKGR
jgi:hypothetical protein